MSPLLALLVACQASYPEAFHYQIDRTLVLGVQAYQRADSSWYYDALVVSPWELQSVQAEICGLRTDVQSVVDARCFGEPALLEVVGRGMPGTFSLPALAYDCEHTGGTGAYGACDSQVPLRIVARSAEDMGSAYVSLALSETVRPPELDPRIADPRLELASGEVVAGGEVRLAFSIPQSWFGTSDPTGLRYRWYVDEGELLGTGRTATTHTAHERIVTENTLRIPEDYSGPLRVAVVVQLSPPVWQTLSLEVP